MSDAIEVTEGRPVQLHELHGRDAAQVAVHLGYDDAKGVSVEDDVVVIHVLTKRNKLRQVRHQIGG
jgi:hypothetical protein